MNGELIALVDRLNVGWAMCEREADPAKRTRLEDHWISLLHAYEAACDQCPARSASTDTTRRAA